MPTGGHVSDFAELGRACAQIALLKITKRHIENSYIGEAEQMRLDIIKREIAGITKTKMKLMAMCKAKIKEGGFYE